MSRDRRRRYDAIVIGAGHNGLVTAAYLAKGGLATLVVERSAEPGGCAASEELWPGFRVDTGAHGLPGLDPRVVSELDLPGAGLELLTPERTVVAPRPGGPALVLHGDIAETARSIRPFSERDASTWPRFVEAMAKAARALEVLYRSLPPRIAGAERPDLWELVRLGAKLGRVGRRDVLELMRLIPMTVEELLDEWFESDALKGAVGAGGITGICQGPMASGTAYLLLHGLLGGGGVVRPRSQVRGGMGALGRALARAASAVGAEVRTGAPVAAIRIADGRAIGVRLESGEELDADVVVSGADPGRTLGGLVDPLELDPDFVRALRNVKYRGVCAKVHLALDELPGLGSDEADTAWRGGAALTLAPSLRYLERAYDDAKYGRPSEAPYVEAVLTTALDPSLAPDGRHILSALVQYAPYRLAEGSWDAERREALGDAVVSALASLAPGLPRAVRHRSVLTPADLAERFALTEGNIYHGEMTLDQVFFMRPVPGWGRHRTPVGGLYLCGAGTHPGGGLTGRPGLGAARVVLADASPRR